VTEILHASWLTAREKLFVWGAAADPAAVRRASAARPFHTAQPVLRRLGPPSGGTDAAIKALLRQASAWAVARVTG
jgi:hypothetical protein